MEEPRNVGSVGTVLASMHEVGPWHSKPGMVVQACNPSSQEVEAGGTGVGGQPVLLIESSLDCKRSLFLKVGLGDEGRGGDSNFVTIKLGVPLGPQARRNVIISDSEE